MIRHNCNKPQTEHKRGHYVCTGLQVVEPREIQHQLSVQEVKGQVQLIQHVMQAVMQEGFHYGVIPGTDKPTLLKPGAEKLTVTFRLAPKLVVEMRDLNNGHREYQVICTLIHIPTGNSYGEGVGSCSTLEAKYRWRKAARECPSCGSDAIIKGRAEYGGGWLCFAKKGGCGAKFADDDTAITEQPIGRIENEDIADVYNTVLKMAKKRALVDATLTATAASDIFTQDVEDFGPEVTPRAPEEARPLREESNPERRDDRPAPSPAPVVTQQQIGYLMGVAKQFGVTEEQLHAHLFELGYASRKDIPKAKLDDILGWVKGQKKDSAE